MSMKSNAPLMSGQHTNAPKAESQAVTTDVPSGGLVTCAPPPASTATPEAQGHSLDEGTTESDSPTKDDTDAQANPSAVADYIPENGTVTQSCLLILLEVSVHSKCSIPARWPKIPGFKRLPPGLEGFLLQ